MRDHAGISLLPGGRFLIRRTPTVRVPDVIMKCVGYVGEAIPDQSDNDLLGDLHATGFFVSVPSSNPGGLPYICFVTARHVALDLEGRLVYFVVNKKGGGVTAMESFGDRWWFHPTDETADVAVMLCNPNTSMDIIAIPIQKFATPELMAKKDIGVGDEVFATGLFSPAQGHGQNMPILRHGNIAMLPTEQLQTELGFADVILVEARSIGGLSGSPVFVRETILVKGNMEGSQEPTVMAGVGQIYLLGLMHGHWDVKESDINNPRISHDAKKGVNLGIGIVVPATKILETLNRPELKKMRDEIDKKQRNVPAMDSARPEVGQPFTKADFEEALKRASRRIQPSQPDGEKSET